MTDPNAAVPAEMREQVEHVMDTMFEGVIGVSGVNRRTAIAAHVGGDAAKAERAKSSVAGDASYETARATRV